MIVGVPFGLSLRHDESSDPVKLVAPVDTGRQNPPHIHTVTLEQIVQLTGLARSKALLEKLESPSFNDLVTLTAAFPRSSLESDLILQRGVQLFPGAWTSHLRTVDHVLAERALSLWAKRCPMDALRFCDRRAPSSKDIVLLAISETKPALAWRLVDASPEIAVDVENIIRRHYFDDLAARNFEEAVAEIDRISSPLEKSECLTALLPTWVGRDPREALSWIETHLSRSWQLRAIHECLTLSLEKHSHWVWEEAADRANPELMKRALRIQAKRDLAGAKAWLHSTAAEGFRRRLLPAILETSEDNTRTLLALVEELHRGGISTTSQRKFENKIKDAILEDIAQEDPTEALSWLGRLPIVHYQADEIIEVLRLSWNVDPDLTFRWVNGMPEGKIRLKLLDYVFKRTSAEAPESIWEKAHALDEDTLPAFAMTLRRLALKHPVPTIQWLSNHESTKDLGVSLSWTAAQWTMFEPEQSSTWIAGMLPGPHRDAAICGMVHAVLAERQSDIDREGGMAWANELGDPILRQEMTHHVQAVTEGSAQNTSLHLLLNPHDSY